MFFKFSKIEDYPTLPQALEAKKEAEIVMFQSIEPFMTNSVKYVVNEIDLKLEMIFKTINSFFCLAFLTMVTLWEKELNAKESTRQLKLYIEANDRPK